MRNIMRRDLQFSVFFINTLKIFVKKFGIFIDM